MDKKEVDKKVYVDVVVSIPLDKLKDFVHLGKHLGKEVPEVLEMCMYERCEDLLLQFSQKPTFPKEASHDFNQNSLFTE